jgi:hypothetical protein
MLCEGPEPNHRDEALESPAGEVIYIQLTRKPWGVSVQAPATEPTACLAALRSACDEIEAQIRMMRVVQLQQQTAENARVAAILAKGRGA